MSTHDNDFRINIRAVHTKCFSTYLMELAIAAFLGTLMTEHWAGIPKALNLIIKKAVLFSCTNAAGCPFRAQRQTITVTIFEGVHLLLNDIGYFTNGAFKQFGLLYDRSTDLSIPISLQDRFYLS